MISDSIPNASIAMASSFNHRDLTKKKRANRSAKLKQCKLDARREQWLSQVKNKTECKEVVESRGQSAHSKSEGGRPIEKFASKTRNKEESYGDGTMMHHYADCVPSPPNSPSSHTSSVMGSNDSGINFTASSRSGSSSGRSSRSSSNGCYSENMSEEGDVGDDSCLDDWEAMADALAANDKKQKEHLSNSEFETASSEVSSQLYATHKPLSGIDISYVKQESGGKSKQRASASTRAWRPDDAYRPQSLPNLTKQFSFPLKSERRFGCGGTAWGCKNLGSVPTSCPICFEDLDYTDSSFLPCPCGFRLCLFCHKRILEEDGRCPGCRKQYEYKPVEGETTYDGGSLTFRLARSCSMVTRF